MPGSRRPPIAEASGEIRSNDEGLCGYGGLLTPVGINRLMKDHLYGNGRQEYRDDTYGLPARVRMGLLVSRSRSWGPRCRKVRQTTASQPKQFPAAVSYENGPQSGIGDPVPPRFLRSLWLFSRAQGLAACWKQEDSHENALCSFGSGHSHRQPDIRHVG